MLADLTIKHGPPAFEVSRFAINSNAILLKKIELLVQFFARYCCVLRTHSVSSRTIYGFALLASELEIRTPASSKSEIQISVRLTSSYLVTKIVLLLFLLPIYYLVLIFSQLPRKKNEWLMLGCCIH